VAELTPFVDGLWAFFDTYLGGCWSIKARVFPALGSASSFSFLGYPLIDTFIADVMLRVATP
jgi:hypothetical protein